MEILRTFNHVGDVYVMLEREIAENPNGLKKILNRKIRLFNI